MKKISSINSQKITDSAPFESKKTENDAFDFETLMPYQPDASRFSVLCRRSDYSASNIAHAIEDSNAHVLNLNITDADPGEDMLVVDVRISTRNVASAARSLARYGYTVVGLSIEDNPITDRDRDRVAELLRYVDL